MMPRAELSARIKPNFSLRHEGEYYPFSFYEEEANLDWMPEPAPLGDVLGST
jgi:hypothetical protein